MIQVPGQQHCALRHLYLSIIRHQQSMACPYLMMYTPRQQTKCHSLQQRCIHPGSTPTAVPPACVACIDACMACRGHCHFHAARCQYPTRTAVSLHRTCRYTVFRVVNLPPVTTSVTACVTLFQRSACPTLGSFCYGYDAFGGCQFAIENKAATCCPTSITSGLV
jgi:hypothetical protein